MRPKAYSYIRFSTKQQAKGGSLKRQLEMTEKLAAKKKLELVRSYQDLGLSGYSGANVQSGAFGKFRDAVRTGKIESGSWLIVENFDRISRQNPWDAFALLAELIGMGITIATVMPEMVVSKKSESMGDLYMVIGVLMRAHEESKMKSTRGLANWQAKRNAGKPMTKQCPAWLKLVDGEYRPIPERVKVLEEIFDLSTKEREIELANGEIIKKKGFGADAIARQLNESGVPVWGKGKRKGEEWRGSYIKKILTGTQHGRHVLGEYQPHKKDPETGKYVPAGKVIPDYFPQVIDEDTWYAAQSAIKRRVEAPSGRGSIKVSNLFGGIMKCAVTGKSIRHTDKGEGLEYLTYSGSPANWPYREFENLFLEALTSLYIRPMAAEEEQQIERLRGQIATSEGRIAEIEGKLDELEREFSRGDMPAGRLTRLVTKMEDEAEVHRDRVGEIRGELLRLERKERDRAAEQESLEELRKQTDDIPVRALLRSRVREQVEKIECRFRKVRRPHKLDLRTEVGRKAYHKYMQGNAESVMIHFRGIDWRRELTLIPVEPTKHLRHKAGHERARRWARWKSVDWINGQPFEVPEAEAEQWTEIARLEEEIEKKMEKAGKEP